MPLDNHVHIISAGQNIHTAYPAIFRTLPTITRTYILADSTIMEFSPVLETQRQRVAVRHAVAAVKEISASLFIPFTSITVYPPVYPSVRTILTKIHRENPGARFTLDLSGGSAALCTALFSFVPWLGGEVYSAFDGKVPGIVPVPDPGAKRMLANPNYQTILAVLIRNNRPANGTPGLPWVPRHYLFTQVWPYYLRSRTRSSLPVDPQKPVTRYRRGRTQANDLSQQTFSSYMMKLRIAGLVEEAQDKKNLKERIYRVTDSGETAFRFFGDTATNSIVKTILEEWTPAGPGT
jgi:DNA-binding transcriptional ArsR family regulator